jgi:hypothetical protein
VINLDDAAWDLYQKVEMEIDDEKEKLPTEQMDDREFSFYRSQNDRENYRINQLSAIFCLF